MKKWLRQYRTRKADSLTSQIEGINAHLDHIDPSSPAAATLERRRVSLFWKRNTLYAKLARS